MGIAFSACVMAERAFVGAVELPDAILRVLFHRCPTAIVVLGADWTVRFWNMAAEQLFGWSEAEVRGRPTPVVPEEARPEAEAIRARLARGEPCVGLGVRRRRRDGTLLDLSLSATPILDPAGRLASVVACFEDARGRRRVEAALHALERLYQVLAAKIPNLIAVCDADLRLTYVSPSAERLLDRSADEMAGQSLEGYLTPAGRARLRTLLDAEHARLAGPGPAPAPPATLELEVLRRAADTAWVETTMLASGTRPRAR